MPLVYTSALYSDILVKLSIRMHTFILTCCLSYLALLPAGNSKGSLIDDVGPWKDPAILAQVEAGK